MTLFHSPLIAYILGLAARMPMYENTPRRKLGRNKFNLPQFYPGAKLARAAKLGRLGVRNVTSAG